jgi:hypothetical protein
VTHTKLIFSGTLSKKKHKLIHALVADELMKNILIDEKNYFAFD